MKGRRDARAISRRRKDGRAQQRGKINVSGV